MKKTTWITVFAAVIVLLTGISAAYASGTVTADVQYYSFKPELNPLYEGLIDLPDEALASTADEADFALADMFYETDTEAAAALRQAMVSRADTVTVGYRVEGAYSEYDTPREIFHLAVAHTGVPDEGDSLAWQWKTRDIDVAVQSEGNVHYLSMSYQIIYYTTAAQETEMDAAVDVLLDELDLFDADDYTKIRGIYNYICSNVTYDHESGSTYYLKYTPYAALVNKTSVCQGYAVLFYRLALELGVDARVIFGVSGGVNHTWNIVRLGDTYFCLDATWDAGKTSYSYFLECEDNFSGHTRKDNAPCAVYYTRSSFYAAYPIGESDYIPIAIPGGSVSGTCGDSLFWKLETDGRLVIWGTGDMDDYVSGTPWSKYTIREVVITDGVTGIGAYAFADCTSLEKICVPASVTSVGEGAFADNITVCYPDNFAGTLTLVNDSDYFIVTGTDSKRYVIVDKEGMDIVTFAENFTDGTGETANLFQLVSADGSDRYTSLEAVKAGMKFQRLDENGGISDEGIVALKGDMNLDGRVTAAEAEILLWSLFKPDEYQIAVKYDVNGDGLANAADAVFIVSELIK